MKPSFFKSLCTCFPLSLVLLFSSCQKHIEEDSVQVSESTNLHGVALKKPTHKYSAEVGQGWLDLQLQILRLSGATPQEPSPNPYGLNGNRYFAYFGIALYQSVLPGMPSYQSLHGQLNDMPQMPDIKNGLEFYWPASANATLAFLTKNFYVNAPQKYRQAMDELEESLNQKFQQLTDAATFQRSVEFGKEVARLIFEWSKTDGASLNYPPYALPTGEGIWSNTPPNPAGIFAPYWGQNRLFVKGSLDNTSSPLPPAYSRSSSSAYYAMVKEVFDISQTLTPEQIATARYFRDNPGFQAGTNYQATFHQVMQKESPDLADFAVAQAKLGIALADAQIGCWKIKYSLLQERPCRYIRDVMGHSSWNPLLTTPPHPDFPSGHSQTGGAFNTIMTSLLGPGYNFTLHTYDVLNMEPRPYTSFDAMVNDIAISRVYAGIHYRYSCTEGKKQGMNIAQNVLRLVRFKK